MRLLNDCRKLKASSLVESVLAIAIISTCATIAFLIYLNVVRQNKSINYYQAKQKIENLLFSTVIDRDYENDVFRFDGYNIHKEVDIDIKKQTVEVSFIIEDGGKKYILKELIPYNGKVY
jgi:Tfp pilus assembly major pilin PilA